MVSSLYEHGVAVTVKTILPLDGLLVRPEDAWPGRQGRHEQGGRLVLVHALGPFQELPGDLHFLFLVEAVGHGIAQTRTLDELEDQKRLVVDLLEAAHGPGDQDELRDWSFAVGKNVEFELVGTGTSRTAGYIMHDGVAYMTCDLGFMWNRFDGQRRLIPVDESIGLLEAPDVGRLLVVLFLGLELMSIPIYVLAAADRDQDASVEAGLKYLILGSFATGVLLFGRLIPYVGTG